MKNTFISFLAVALLSTCLNAATKHGYQTATVVSVTQRDTSSNDVGDNPSDAPLQTQIYAYQIGLRLNCSVYQVLYETPLDYLPAIFSPTREVKVNLQKHDMYVSFPGDRELRLSISDRHSMKDGSCVAGG